MVVNSDMMQQPLDIAEDILVKYPSPLKKMVGFSLSQFFQKTATRSFG